MRQKQVEQEEQLKLSGPLTGGNFNQVDSSVKKILCPALALPNQTIHHDTEEQQVS